MFNSYSLGLPALPTQKTWFVHRLQPVYICTSYFTLHKRLIVCTGIYLMLAGLNSLPHVCLHLLVPRLRSISVNKTKRIINLNFNV